MHLILIIHWGAKVMVDQNGAMFVKRREDAEIRAGDDENTANK
jgi:hypothetical protein